MARKYNRDNRGRFASGGGGATARGGRLRTASGGKRATQTMKAEAAGGTGVIRGRAARTVAGESAMRRMAAPKAESAPKSRPMKAIGAARKSRQERQAQRVNDFGKDAAVRIPGAGQAAPRGAAFRGDMRALKERRRIGRATRQMNTPKRGK